MSGFLRLFRGMFMLLLLDQGGDVLLKRLKTNERPKTSIALLEDVGVFEVVFELSGPLDPCIADLADLHRVELVPLALMELVVEVSDELGVYEVEEGVSDVAVVLS